MRVRRWTGLLVVAALLLAAAPAFAQGEEPPFGDPLLRQTTTIVRGVVISPFEAMPMGAGGPAGRFRIDLEVEGTELVVITTGATVVEAAAAAGATGASLESLSVGDRVVITGALRDGSIFAHTIVVTQGGGQ